MKQLDLSRVYDKLAAGGFICSNSLDTEEKAVFRLVEEQFETCYDYFKKIGLVLEKGTNYFYFSRNESRGSLKHKIEKYCEWIIIEDFLMSFDSSFNVGFRFRTLQMENKVNMDSDCKRKLIECVDHRKRLTSKMKDVMTDRERVDFLLKTLKAEGFIEEVSAEDGEWQVTDAFDYLLQIHELMRIKGTADSEDA